MTADATMLERFAALDSAALSDALEACGLAPGQGGLPPMCGQPRIAGFAVTAELGPLAGEHGGAHILTDVVAAAGSDSVLVVANCGRTDVSAWGGILSTGASVRSVRGVIIDGACRDVGQARERGFRCSRAARCRSPRAAACVSAPAVSRSASGR
jgi:regulator of RNase E activity RraA